MSHFDQFPKVHPRYYIVREAESDIHAAIAAGRFTYEERVTAVAQLLLRDGSTGLYKTIHDLAERYALTRAELIQILSGELAMIAKYSIRTERHPNDPDKPGDCE